MAYPGIGTTSTRRDQRLTAKIQDFHWGLLLLLVLIAGTGFALLYSVADGSWDPWAKKQVIRFAVSMLILSAVALVDIRVWMGLAYPFYVVALALLVGVELMGYTGMGAQRWIDLGFIQLQPSELMKIALVVALARYFHNIRYESVSRITYMIPPLLMIAAPAALVLKQPDLGTTLMLVAGGLGVFFLAGLKWRYIVSAVIAAIPVAWYGWRHVLRDYQRERILTFLDPSANPLGSGWQITQAKISLGSGGLAGKGFLEGTQRQLNFTPEQHTDFIFTVLAEEFGFMGASALLLLYVMVLGVCIGVAMESRSQFGRLVASGVAVTFMLYVLINVAMVMGLIPVVGVPLPLVSYGGTQMMTLLFGFGLVMSVHVHRNVEVPKGASDYW